MILKKGMIKLIKTVIKRDGTEVPFNYNKIVNAILKANNEVPEDKRLKPSDAKKIAIMISGTKSTFASVEAIQDAVERCLMFDRFFEVAKAFMLYREKRAMVRKSNTTDESIMKLIRNENKEMNEENSNKNPKMASTQRDYIAGIVSRDLTRRLLLPTHISKAHDDGVLHFHDADYFLQPIHNC